MRDTVITSDANTEVTPPKHSSGPAHNPLFRQQVIEHVRVRQYGSVILTRPVSHLILTCVFVTLALLLIVFFAVFETTRKAPIQGMLVPTAGVTLSLIHI